MIWIGVSVVAYSRILAREGPLQALIPTIPQGENSYILSNDKGCVGEFHTSMKFYEGHYEFIAHGFIRIHYQDQVVEPQVELNASFNSIGQLGGSILRVRRDDNELRAGTKDLNPLHVIFYIREGSKEKNRYETLVPGPITLRKNGDGSFRLEYLHFGKVISNYSGLLKDPSLNRFALHPQKVESEKGACRGTSAIDVPNLNSYAAFLGVPL